jgi:hypothetical protein
MLLRAVLLLSLTLGGLLLPQYTVHADPNGVITGELKPGTADGPSVGGVEVRLFMFKGDQGDEQAERSGTTDADGKFRFEGVDTSDEYTYQVAANYAGLPYGTGGIKFAAGETAQDVKIDVFDVTQENPGIYADSASFLLIGADKDSEYAYALEISEIVNPSNKAYQPLPSATSGPMNLVRFSLPAGATDLTAHLGMTDDEMIQVDRGFATTAVILPGTHEFMYAYRFPYSGGKAAFTKNLWYGAKQFTLLALENTGDLSVPSLKQGDTVDIQGQRFRMWSGSGLAAGATVQLDFSKLPEPAFRLPFHNTPGVAYGGMGIIGALAAFAALLLYQRRAARLATAPAGPALPDGEIGDYLTALAELDDRFLTGQVPEVEYQRERDALKDDLKDLLRERDLQLAVAGDGQ